MKAGTSGEGEKKLLEKKGEDKIEGGVKNKKGENGREDEACWGCNPDNDEL